MHICPSYGTRKRRYKRMLSDEYQVHVEMAKSLMGGALLYPTALTIWLTRSSRPSLTSSRDTPRTATLSIPCLF